MAKTNKKSLSIGVLLAASFFGVLLLIFSPVFGDGRNGLTYADDMFNKLSKGSSYFIPDLRKDSEKFNGQALSVKISAAKPDDKPGDTEKRIEDISRVLPRNEKVDQYLEVVNQSAFADELVIFIGPADTAFNVPPGDLIAFAGELAD